MKLSNMTTRAGVVLSAIWIVLGGYYIYLQNSNQDHWETVRGICAVSPSEVCSQYTAEANELFPPDWLTISLYVAVGLVAIWAALFALAWVKNAKVPPS